MHRFEEKLEKDIYKKMIQLTMVMGVIIVLGFLGMLIVTDSEQLQRHTNQIEATILKERQEIQTLLEQVNREEARRYWLDQSNERLLMSTIYQTIPQSSHASYYIVSTEGEVLYASQGDNSRQLIVTNYLQTVVKNVSAEGHRYDERITYDSHHQGYYIALAPLWIDMELRGYSILAIPGENIFGQSVDNMQYLIAGKYDDVLRANTMQFISEKNKVNKAVFQHSIVMNQQWLAVTRQKRVTDNIVLYTYFHVLDVPVFLMLVGSLLVIWMISLVGMSNSISKRIAKKNAQSVDELVANTQLIMGGYQFHIQMSRDDEFGYLASQINQMVDELYRLYNNSLDLENQKRLVERKLLEAQFNPHFLYNTLETIRITGYDDPRMAEQLILCLNRVLRYSLDEHVQSVAMRDDLRILEDFLQINRARFEQFDYKIHMTEEAASIRVPKLFLLPLVENAIKYGMKARPDLSLRITGVVEDSRVIYEVLDNGPGFQDELETILRRQIESQETHHGIGNTFQRLRYVYPSVTFQRVSGEWGGIRIMIQVKEGETDVSDDYCRG